MIDFEAIRGTLATRYNFLFDKDDPTLATVALFEAALEQSLGTLNEQQQATLKALLNSQQKSHEETKRLAKKVVDEGTEYACDQISTAITATMDEGREEIRKDLRLAWNKMDHALKVALGAAGVSSVCALVTVAVMMLNVA